MPQSNIDNTCINPLREACGLEGQFNVIRRSRGRLLRMSGELQSVEQRSGGERFQFLGHIQNSRLLRQDGIGEAINRR